jgi:hypothetical protein
LSGIAHREQQTKATTGSAMAATATRRAAAARNKRRRIKRARMLITGGIGAAPGKTPAREKHCGCICQKGYV